MSLLFKDIAIGALFHAKAQNSPFVCDYVKHQEDEADEIDGDLDNVTFPRIGFAPDDVIMGLGFHHDTYCDPAAGDNR